MEVGFKLLIEFATDTMKFVLAMSGCGYDGLFERREEWIPDTFEYVFGQAVFYYRQSHLERFEEMIQSYHDLIFQDEATILSYIKYGVKKIAKGDSLLMDLLRILAFYADFIIYCQRFDNRKDIVAVVIKYFSEIYNYAGVRDLLQNCGSYSFLRMAAEEIIGPRVHEISFVERMTRYRQLLQQGSPDRRRVSFSLPDENEKNASHLTPSPEAGRLESCLSMFANVPLNHSRENGFMEDNNHLQSTASSSNADLSAPSTSGTHAHPVDSSDSEEENEHLKKKSTLEFKPQSILKSPHGIKSHKRTASDETASNKTKRSRTDESPGKAESHSGEEDPNISTHALLIHIPDIISEELRVSLDNISEKILNYNKTRTGPDAYDVDSESLPKLPESKHTETNKDTPKDSDFSPKDGNILKEVVKLDTGSSSKSLETSVEETKKLEKIERENTSAATADTGETSAVEICPATSSIHSNSQTAFMEIDSVVRGGISSEGSKTGISDSLIVEASDDSQYSSMSDDSNNQNESARINIVSDFNERSENSATSTVPSQKLKTGNNSTPDANPVEISTVEISPIVSNVLHDNQTKCKEFKMTVADYGLHYEFAESIELGASVEVVTSIESDHKPDVTEVVKTETCEKVDSSDCPITSTDLETGENKPDNSVKDLSSEDSDNSNTQNKPERKDTVSDSSVHSENPETNLKPSEERKQTENVDTSNGDIGDSGKMPTVIISQSEACTPKDNEIVSTSSEVSKCVVIKPSDSLETASSGDSECRFDAPKDVESCQGEVKVDLNDRDRPCEFPETDVCKSYDSQTVNSDSTKSSDFNTDSDTEPVKTCIDTDSSVNDEKMDCDQVEIGNSDSSVVKDSEKSG